MEEDVSILTYKIKLYRSFVNHRTKTQLQSWWNTRRKINKYLRVAKRIAKWVILPENKQKKITTKDTKHLGKINSDINNQIIRKYKGNKKIKHVSNVNLIVPGKYTQKYPNVRYNKDKGILRIVPLKLTLKWTCPISFTKINQVEINNEYVYICLNTTPSEKKNYRNTIGVDLNIKHNLATVGDPQTGQHKYLGKDYIYKRIKYREIRRRLQRQIKTYTLKRMGNKDS